MGCSGREMQPAVTHSNWSADTGELGSVASHSLYVPLPVFGARKAVCAAFRLSQSAVICRNGLRVPKNAVFCHDPSQPAANQKSSTGSVRIRPSGFP